MRIGMSGMFAIVVMIFGVVEGAPSYIVLGVVLLALSWVGLNVVVPAIIERRARAPRTETEDQP